ncbi:MAG: replicative DNA helicase [Chlamydiota bacterium]
MSKFHLDSFSSRISERIILSRMLHSFDDRRLCLNLLKPNSFFFEEHSCLFSFLHSLQKEEKNFNDLPTIIEEAQKRKLLEKIGGHSYLFELFGEAPTSGVDLASYLKSVKEFWVKREALFAIGKFSKGIENSEDVGAFLEGFIQEFKELQQTSSLVKSQSFSALSSGYQGHSCLDMLSFRREFYQKYNRPFVDGVSSGYADLDQLIGGFGNSNLIICASRPGMGKTALALNFARRVASTRRVGIISLEMSARQLYERFLSMETGVPSDILREGRMNDKQWETVKQEEPKVAQLPIYITEGLYFIRDLVAKVRSIRDQEEIDLFIIDYLQLLQAPAENRLMEVSLITRQLKLLAVELHLPIVCLAQLSRKVEERADHRPLLSDLRESGSIEQDADVVSFLVRPDYYDSRDRPGESDLIVAKNRHGKTGCITLCFSKESSKFEPFSAQREENYDLF